MSAPSNISAVEKSASSISQRHRQSELKLEVYGLLIVALSAILLLSLISYDPTDLRGGVVGDSTNLIGPVGTYMASFFVTVCGLGSFGLAICFLITGGTIVVGKPLRLGLKELGYGCLLFLCGTILLHILAGGAQVWNQSPGGVIGEYTGEAMRAFFSTVGTAIMTITAATLSIVMLTERSLRGVGRSLRARAPKALISARQVLLRGWTRLRRRQMLKDSEATPITRAVVPFAATPVNAGGQGESGRPKIVDRRPTPRTGFDGAGSPVDQRQILETLQSMAPPPRPVDNNADTIVDATAPVRLGASESSGTTRPPLRAMAEPRRIQDAVAEKPAVEKAAEDLSPPLVAAKQQPTQTASDDAPGPKIIESAAMKSAGRIELDERHQQPLPFDSRRKPYEPFPLSLLNFEPPSSVELDRENLRDNAERLEETLRNYGVKGRVVEIHPGPVVTTYEFLPEAGVKISKIANLADDLTMALAAHSVRIVAPIPGKGVVGIEVPNKRRDIVFLKEIFGSRAYQKHKHKLTIALGKDIVGNPVAGNLGKMPHLLIAGATGSGKSVGLNGVICSLLYNASPDDVKMILVDPKMLELSVYSEIPHLLLPVVTDPKMANLALKWAVEEMERRYKMLAKMGVRNIANYNRKIEEMDDDLREEAGFEKLPYIVVIIDELADLMMVASKDVETSITRLAQMARAAGIHLILATQRPSVDVITGLIKANFPSRISFKVSSKIDSRTILDAQGAEKLLGHGDMLYLGPGTSELQRIHNALVSDEEVKRVADFVRQQGEPDYKFEILDTESREEDGEELDYDVMYDQAVYIVTETRQASISYLQRRLKVGYNRAARMIEIMEKEGIVGESDGSKPRKVLVPPPSSIE